MFSVFGLPLQILLLLRSLDAGRMAQMSGRHTQSHLTNVQVDREVVMIISAPLI